MRTLMLDLLDLA
jgi:signal transduction histidine kinase